MTLFPHSSGRRILRRDLLQNHLPDRGHYLDLFPYPCLFRVPGHLGLIHRLWAFYSPPLNLRSIYFSGTVYEFRKQATVRDPLSFRSHIGKHFQRSGHGLSPACRRPLCRNFPCSRIILPALAFRLVVMMSTRLTAMPASLNFCPASSKNFPIICFEPFVG